jgi:putative SOS response-associated peptidase YedK
MCGRLNVVDCPEVIDLCGQLGISLKDNVLRTGRFIRAASTISIVIEKDKQRLLQDAIWWLLLDQTETGFKPSAYTSFNTRYDKLDVPRSAGYYSYRHQRCIIPAMGFGETEQINGKAVYHDFTSETGIAFGGLYREWKHSLTGEIVFSCSVITLAPHPKLMPYHSKASPLLIPPTHYDVWLNAATDISNLTSLLKPHLHITLKCMEILKPSIPESKGQEFWLQPDAHL